MSDEPSGTGLRRFRKAAVNLEAGNEPSLVTLIFENGSVVQKLTRSVGNRHKPNLECHRYKSGWCNRKSPQRAAFESFLELSRANTKVEKAFRIYGSREHTWSNLYIIYEIIESDVGGNSIIVNNCWSSKSQIETFKRTANSVTAAGDDARHGKENTVPPSPSMLLSEAESLIEGLLRQWLLTK